MPRIRCHYIDCTFNDDLFCSAATIEVDPKLGCITFSNGDKDEDGKNIVDEELEEIDEESDDDDDLWAEDDDDDEEEEAY
ncbi:MAG: hypothetical protein NTW32_22860 [Chloroflexi bacterium]|nr:hypothetical protein [Chloroflexota bacterium]